MLGRHALGLYEKALPTELDWPERLALAGQLGFDYMELSVDETDRRLARLTMPDDELVRLRRAMEQSGVPIRSICLSAHRRFPYGSADPALRRQAGEIMEAAVRLAARLGVRVIQLAGYDVYYEPSTPESLALFLEGLRAACRLAEREQVMLAMEIMDTQLMSSIRRYLDWKAKLPSPWFRLYPDLGNLTAWGNDVPAELRLGRDEIVAVHVKDTRPVAEDGKGQFKCVPFGGGTVDFPACFRTLEEQGYQGPYLLEMWAQPGGDARAEVAAAAAYIRERFYEGTGTL